MSVSRTIGLLRALARRVTAWCGEQLSRLWAACRRQPRRFWVEASLLATIFLYGALLRFEALFRKYQSVLENEGLVQLQAGLASFASWIRPASFAWTTDEAITAGHYPYWGDQRGYIGLARAAGTFYEAQVREPLFVLSTKVALALTNGHEIALSLMSTTFSALVPLATYALGREMGGPAAGLSAALLVAIHRDMIAWSTDGWRADLFTGLTVLFAYACVRMYRRPSRPGAVFVGTIGALACLTRITALSFVTPAIVALTFLGRDRGWRRPDRHALVAGVVVLVLVAPYLVNCWIDYGDPLYAISFHTAFYQRAAGADVTEGQGIATFVASRLTDDPFLATDSVLRGLTFYAWANKWNGLGAHWGSWLAGFVAVLSLFGMLVWMWSAEGRLLLLIYASSLFPFVLNWELPGGSAWRFTMPAYPFLIVAATHAGSMAARTLWGLKGGEVRVGQRLRESVRPVLATTALVGGLAAFVYLLPLINMGYELSRGRAFSVAAGPRDAVFFRRDWRPRERLGNQTVRFVRGMRGSLWVPLLGGRSYRLTLRLHPAPAARYEALATDVRLNGSQVERLQLQYDSERIGSYQLHLPATLTRTGFNLLEIEAVPSRPVEDTDTTFMVWYLWVEPEPPQR